MPSVSSIYLMKTVNTEGEKYITVNQKSNDESKDSNGSGALVVINQPCVHFYKCKYAYYLPSFQI